MVVALSRPFRQLASRTPQQPFRDPDDHGRIRGGTAVIPHRPRSVDGIASGCRAIDGQRDHVVIAVDAEHHLAASIEAVRPGNHVEKEQNRVGERAAVHQHRPSLRRLLDTVDESLPVGAESVQGQNAGKQILQAFRFRSTVVTTWDQPQQAEGPLERLDLGRDRTDQRVISAVVTKEPGEGSDRGDTVAELVIESADEVVADGEPYLGGARIFSALVH